MSDKPKSLEEYYDRLYGGFGRARSTQEGKQFLNFAADIRIILGDAIRMTHAALYTSQWPELFTALETPEQSAEEVRQNAYQFGRKVYDFCARACDPNAPAEDRDWDIRDTMNAVDWHGGDPKARTVFLAMLGLFVLSRTWVVCRQEVGLGVSRDVALEPIIVAAGQTMRMWDQKIDPVDEGIDLVKYAVNHAIQCGLPRKRIEEIVSEVLFTSLDDPQAGPPAPEVQS